MDPSLQPLGDELLAKFEDTERALLTVGGLGAGCSTITTRPPNISSRHQLTALHSLVGAGC